MIMYIDYETLKSIFATNQIEKDKIIIWLNRLKKFDLKIHYRFFKCQHINIVDDLNKMSIKLHFINDLKTIEKLIMSIIEFANKNEQFENFNSKKIRQHTNSLNYLFEKNLIKYYRFFMYNQIMKYLTNEKNRMNVLKIDKNRKKTLKKLIKKYQLSKFNESKYLKYKKINEKMNICIVEKK